MEKCFRQGEILFIPLKDVPQWLKDEENLKPMNTKVIREGEVSGHMHEVVGSGEMFELPRNRWDGKTRVYKKDENFGSNYQFPSGDMFLTADNDIVVKHPEHKSLKLKKGDYVIRIQREYDEEENRRVLD